MLNLKTATDDKKDSSNSKKDPQHHNIWSYGYKVICVDQQHYKSYDFFFEEYVFDKLIHDIISFNKLLIMTRKSCEDFKFYLILDL